MTQQTIIIPEKINDLKNKLKGTGWENIINPYLDSENFYNTLHKLVDMVQNDTRFTPPMKDWFKAFETCHHDKLKVVFIGQDPYPQLGVADGISFSCSKTMKEQPSLRHIFNSLEKQYPNYERNPDLTRWSEQGVLMLNTALTVQINKIGSHYSLWHLFTTGLLNSLNNYPSQLVVVLLGKKAQEWQKLLLNHVVIQVEHPAAAAYKGGVWNDQDLFLKVNSILKEQGKSLIQW
jgi:uracil-DNA glycosylase